MELLKKVKSALHLTSHAETVADIAKCLSVMGKFICVHEGWLYKRGHVRKNWKKRYFILFQPGLILYLNDASHISKLKSVHIDVSSATPHDIHHYSRRIAIECEVLGSILIVNKEFSADKLGDFDDHHYVFKVISHKKPYFISCTNENDLNIWEKKIRESCTIIQSNNLINNNVAEFRQHSNSMIVEEDIKSDENYMNDNDLCEWDLISDQRLNKAIRNSCIKIQQETRNGIELVLPFGGSIMRSDNLKGLLDEIEILKDNENIVSAYRQFLDSIEKAILLGSHGIHHDRSQFYSQIVARLSDNCNNINIMEEPIYGDDEVLFIPTSTTIKDNNMNNNQNNRKISLPPISDDESDDNMPILNKPTPTSTSNHKSISTHHQFTYSFSLQRNMSESISVSKSSSSFRMGATMCIQDLLSLLRKRPNMSLSLKKNNGLVKNVPFLGTSFQGRINGEIDNYPIPVPLLFIASEMITYNDIKISLEGNIFILFNKNQIDFYDTAYGYHIDTTTIQQINVLLHDFKINEIMDVAIDTDSNYLLIIVKTNNKSDIHIIKYNVKDQKICNDYNNNNNNNNNIEDIYDMSTSQHLDNGVILSYNKVHCWTNLNIVKSISIENINNQSRCATTPMGIYSIICNNLGTLICIKNEDIAFSIQLWNIDEEQIVKSLSFPVDIIDDLGDVVIPLVICTSKKLYIVQIRNSSSFEIIKDINIPSANNNNKDDYTSNFIAARFIGSASEGLNNRLLNIVALTSDNAILLYDTLSYELFHAVKRFGTNVLSLGATGQFITFCNNIDRQKNINLITVWSDFLRMERSNKLNCSGNYFTATLCNEGIMNVLNDNVYSINDKNILSCYNLTSENKIEKNLEEKNLQCNSILTTSKYIYIGTKDGSIIRYIHNNNNDNNEINQDSMYQLKESKAVYLLYFDMLNKSIIAYQYKNLVSISENDNTIKYIHEFNDEILAAQKIQEGEEIIILLKSNIMFWSIQKNQLIDITINYKNIYDSKQLVTKFHHSNWIYFTKNQSTICAINIEDKTNIISLSLPHNIIAIQSLNNDKIVVATCLTVYVFQIVPLYQRGELATKTSHGFLKLSTFTVDMPILQMTTSNWSSLDLNIITEEDENTTSNNNQSTSIILLNSLSEISILELS